MRINLARSLSVFAAVLVFFALAVSRADDDLDQKAIDAAKADVVKFADALANGTKTTKDLSTDAAELAKRHAIYPASRLFVLTKRGGIGIGSLVEAGHKNSIELLIRDFTIKPPTKAEVTEYSQEIVKAAQITLVIAEMTPHWGPAKDVGRKTRARWLALSKDMKAGATELLAAARAKDEKAVEAAAKKLNASCAECHKTDTDR